MAGGESHRVCGAENSWDTTLVSENGDTGGVPRDTSSVSGILGWYPLDRDDVEVLLLLFVAAHGLEHTEQALSSKLVVVGRVCVCWTAGSCKPALH